MFNALNYNKAVAAFPLASVSATGRSQAIDTAKTNGTTLLLDVGTHTTGTPDGSNKFALKVQHSDSLAAASFEDVPDTFFLTHPNDALAKLPTDLDAAGKFGKGYIAALRKTPKRYLTVVWTKTGTVAAPFSLVALQDSVGDLPPSYTTAGQLAAGTATT